MWLSGRRESAPAHRLKNQRETKSTTAHSNLTLRGRCWTLAQEIDEFPAREALFSFWPGKIPAWNYWGGGLDDLCCSPSAVGDHLIPFFLKTPPPPTPICIHYVCYYGCNANKAGEKEGKDGHTWNRTYLFKLREKPRWKSERGPCAPPNPLKHARTHTQSRAL